MRLLFILSFVLLSKLSFADAWDNLTKEEAEKVVDFLNKNPYIFNYCDCCDSEGEYATKAYFVKVTSTRIEACSWDAGSFSVKYDFTPIAEVKYTNNGLDFSQLKSAETLTSDDPIYMNYTWGWNSEKMQATPIFDIVKYSQYGKDHKPCKTPFAFPNPKLIDKVIKDKAYKKWYKKNVA